MWRKGKEKGHCKVALREGSMNDGLAGKAAGTSLPCASGTEKHIDGRETVGFRCGEPS